MNDPPQPGSVAGLAPDLESLVGQVADEVGHCDPAPAKVGC